MAVDQEAAHRRKVADGPSGESEASLSSGSVSSIADVARVPGGYQPVPSGVSSDPPLTHYVKTAIAHEKER
jgi:hypothetical protein